MTQQQQENIEKVVINVQALIESKGIRIHRNDTNHNQDIDLKECGSFSA